MDIRPIKTESDYQAALKEIESLFDAEPNTPEGDRLEVLTTLAEAYEDLHYSIPLPDPIEAILYFMESRGLSRRDLESFIGNRARVSEILNRKRPLSLKMIQNLHSRLGIPAEVLLQPYRIGKGGPHISSRPTSSSRVRAQAVANARRSPGVRLSVRRVAKGRA